MKPVNKFNPFLLILLFQLTYFITYSQINDAGLWLSPSIEKKITSKVSVSINPAFRFNENITELGTFFTDAGLDYKINKRIRVSGNYRIISRRKLDDSYGIRHRFYADLSYRKKIKQFSLTWRLRLLNQYTEILSSERGSVPDYAVRNKLQIKYETDSKYAPFVSGEIWYGINFRENQFRRYRVVGGVEMEINKYNSIALSYIFQRELNAANPEINYISCIGYNYSF